MNEIERKFLVKNINNIDLSLYRKKSIEQTYLYTDGITFIRKRKIEENSKSSYYYTVKTGKTSKYGINEFETEINKKIYDKLMPTQKTNAIIKDRYYIPLENSLTIELDIFGDIFEGIIFAEVEFKNEEEAINFNIPTWFDKELSDKISNSMMTKLTRKEFDNLLQQLS